MCNCIHELLSVFEDSAQREHTIVIVFPLLLVVVYVVVIIVVCNCNSYLYLIQNSQAVKKECSPQKGYGEKRCEIQGGGQEMAVMVD